MTAAAMWNEDVIPMSHVEDEWKQAVDAHIRKTASDAQCVLLDAEPARWAASLIAIIQDLDRQAKYHRTQRDAVLRVKGGAEEDLRALRVRAGRVREDRAGAALVQITWIMEHGDSDPGRALADIRTVLEGLQ